MHTYRMIISGDNQSSLAVQSDSSQRGCHAAVISTAFCLDEAQGHINGAHHEIRTH